MVHHDTHHEGSCSLDNIEQLWSPITSNSSTASRCSVRSKSSARSKSSIRSRSSISSDIGSFIEEASSATEHEQVVTGGEAKPRLVSARKSQAYAACVAQIDEWGKVVDSVRSMPKFRGRAVPASEQAYDILVKMYTLRDLIMRHQAAEAKGAAPNWFTAMQMW
mmetsp:Transcript_55189/g.103643  ORF Transcript_55189/g.103643 Transcript_55189/m.103643 type:complete len:164 (-) Transcript_55189:121-612(-)